MADRRTPGGDQLHARRQGDATPGRRAEHRGDDPARAGTRAPGRGRVGTSEEQAMEIGALVKELQSGISARGTSGYWEMPRLQGRGDGGGGNGGGGMPRISWSFDSGLPDPSTFPIDDLCRITE